MFSRVDKNFTVFPLMYSFFVSVFYFITQVLWLTSIPQIVVPVVTPFSIWSFHPLSEYAVLSRLSKWISRSLTKIRPILVLVKHKIFRVSETVFVHTTRPPFVLTWVLLVDPPMMILGPFSTTVLSSVIPKIKIKDFR